MPVEEPSTASTPDSRRFATATEMLHFAMLVGDTYVDPLEWWDAKWVQDHVEVRLQAPGG